MLTPICLRAERRRHFGTVEGLRAQAEKKPAYVTAEVQVSDPTAFQAYAAEVPATLATYHGRYIVRGKPEVKEGTAPRGVPMRIRSSSGRSAKSNVLIVEDCRSSRGRAYGCGWDWCCI
jgi:Domain of unknown function (DUF1330)